MLNKNFSENNVSYGHRDNKTSKININLTKIVTYSVTYQYLKYVNMSSYGGKQSFKEIEMLSML
jgi:hypothetical protein|tara:strand:+ start:206 stop:397 length:192 start_codon:yes stop_codon:yes gene_type:complete